MFLDLQVHSDITGSAPFLVLNEKKKMMLLPLLYLHREALYPGNSTSWTEVPSASAEVDFPLKRWVHVGCEVHYKHPSNHTSIHLWISLRLIFCHQFSHKN